MNNKRRVRWLHLSDLHFGAGDQYNRNTVLNSLLEDLRAIREREGFVPDFIFITGDLAYSGQPQEYDIASRFLSEVQQRTDVPSERIVCVPGNHDVDRSRVTPFLARSAEAFRERDHVSEVLGNSSELSLFTDRHRHYSDFVSANFAWAKQLTPAGLQATLNMVVNNSRVAVLALNSAWLAGADYEKGRIVIGERQVRKALEEVDSAEIVVALLHHPLSYLADFDVPLVRRLLEERCDFILHGHVHDLGVVNVVSPDSEVFYLAAGAIYVSRNETLSYNAVTLDLDHGTVDVLLRRYSDERGVWLPDTQLYHAAPAGVLSFPLPERLSHRPQPVDPSYVKSRFAEFVSVEMEGIGLLPEISVPDVPSALVESVRAGNCILFAGAGASADAKLPTWQELVMQLIDRVRDAGTVSESEIEEIASLLEAGDLLILADFCRERLGKHDFAEYLGKALSDTNRSSRIHRLLAGIPFRAAITSNFDPFIENSRKGVRVILPETMDRLGGVGVEGILSDQGVFPVVKIHGSYDAVDSIILTHGDFRDALFKMPMYRQFLSRLFTDVTIFFYGYALKDPSVDFVLQELMTLYEGRTRPHYALMPNPGTIKREYLRRGYNIRIIPYELWNGSHMAAVSFLEALVHACGIEDAD